MPEGEEYDSAKLLNMALANMKLYEDDGVPAFINLPPTDTLGIMESRGKLAIGSAGAALHFDNLERAEITHIVNLCRQSRNIFPDKFKYLKVDDMTDDGTIESAEAFRRCLDCCTSFIHDALEGGGNVLVHCYQGKSRSTAICCAYMLKYYPEKYPNINNALDAIREVRPLASPNINFVPTLLKMSASRIMEEAKEIIEK